MSESQFTGSVPRLYDACYAPAVFVPFAPVTARAVADGEPTHVLEVAAGTGRATVAIAAALPCSRIVATDISDDMLTYAAGHRCAPNITWRLADAQELPFPDASFDVVACQFGAMFFPDRPRAYTEARRVLRPGGRLVLTIWDAVEHHAYARLTTVVLRRLFPDDPPRFAEQVPHGYHDTAQIERDLRAGGFDRVQVARETVVGRSRSARDVATGQITGTPLGAHISARDPALIPRVVDEVTDAFRAELADPERGPDAVAGELTAYVVTAH
ncbi:methyltransferase domain-containing protein [Luteipulveratus sp. YIM 133132]|uniref:class I SAM-dependent methyltransferase n=1 Tax=Luteipulveratus flavus TaxID=3031728 RepID=UPI0023B0F94F|nr:methyltransferase domain-containing protein [Luteipulveratus sp. YIM 133132]MDE9365432.1 methyltransferase domain-containing protein [Luteipulveratus sp. YIM 133132]